MSSKDALQRAEYEQRLHQLPSFARGLAISGGPIRKCANAAPRSPQTFTYPNMRPVTATGCGPPHHRRCVSDVHRPLLSQAWRGNPGTSYETCPRMGVADGNCGCNCRPAERACWRYWPRRFGCRLHGEDVESTLEVVGDGGEKNLGGGAGTVRAGTRSEPRRSARKVYQALTTNRHPTNAQWFLTNHSVSHGVYFRRGSLSNQPSTEPQKPIRAQVSLDLNLIEQSSGLISAVLLGQITQHHVTYSAMIRVGAALICVDKI